MFQLLETIRIKNNTPCNIQYHNNRVNHSRQCFYNLSELWRLEDRMFLAGLNSSGLYKCRILYGVEIDSIEIVPYTFPKICTLRLIKDNSIDYSFKYSDREKLNNLKNRAEGADDILIVKNGLITDTSFANIVFFDGSKWFTPANPLLKGTKRQYYMDQNIIFEKKIGINDLPFFKKARIINAMIDLEESEDIDIANIQY